MKTLTLGVVMSGLLAGACMPMNMPWAGGGGAPAAGTAGVPAANPGGGQVPADTAPPPEVLAVTGSSKNLQRLTKDDGHEARPRLSPDGSRLLASSWRDEVVGGAYTGNFVEQSIISMRPDGRARNVLSKRGVPAFDAAWLPKSFVYIANVMGGVQLVRAAKAAPGAAYSVVVRADDAPAMASLSTPKDGSLIVFHTMNREVSTIATVRPDGTDLMMIGEGTNPRISPDGKRIAFERQVNGRWQIFTMDVEGNDLTTVTDIEATNGSANWSPDGAWLVFVSNAGSARFPNPETAFNLFAIRPDGTGLVQLTDGPRHSTEPFWGSDGWIYFTSTEGGTWDLWRIKPVLD